MRHHSLRVTSHDSHSSYEFVGCQPDKHTTNSGNSSGRLEDFVESLSIIIDQFDRIRRQRNWYEVAHTSSRQKQIELAVNRALERARTAAKAYAARVDELGLAADDGNPEVMATAEPIADAQFELWDALGMPFDGMGAADATVPAISDVFDLIDGAKTNGHR